MYTKGYVLQFTKLHIERSEVENVIILDEMDEIKLQGSCGDCCKNGQNLEPMVHFRVHHIELTPIQGFSLTLNFPVSVDGKKFIILLLIGLWPSKFSLDK